MKTDLERLVGRRIDAVRLAEHSLGGAGVAEASYDGQFVYNAGVVLVLDDGSEVAITGPHDEGVVINEAEPPNGLSSPAQRPEE